MMFGLNFRFRGVEKYASVQTDNEQWTMSDHNSYYLFPRAEWIIFLAL